jgi:ABC-type transport system involved in cytochrome c biogenesis permease subunit
MTAAFHHPESAWFALGAAVYVLAALCAVTATMATAGSRGATAVSARMADTLARGLLALGLGLVGGGIALRWQRLGHGPFLNLFEILASSLFSLGFAYGFALWRLPAIRRTGAIVLPVLAMMALWLLATSPADTHLPPTYETPVLWIHVLMGKVFLGCALVALGIAGVILLRGWRLPARGFACMPANPALDRLAWRFMLAALVFETLMLVTGALWAQDAWGRYWAWDPLETWAFTTWLAMVGAVHARASWQISPRAGAWFIGAVFVLAFLTFFGVPFVSVAPHKGAV